MESFTTTDLDIEGIQEDIEDWIAAYEMDWMRKLEGMIDTMHHWKVRCRLDDMRCVATTTGSRLSLVIDLRGYNVRDSYSY